MVLIRDLIIESGGQRISYFCQTGTFMEQEGLKPKDLEPYLKGKNRVSEVLNRKRGLSLAMMRALHRGLGIPAEVLLREAR
jgi:antitoxin component HigA of HigAB toxin-antitoxin module